MKYPTLRRGDQGVDVAHLQMQLNKVGAMLTVDADFGPATRTGVHYAEKLAHLPLTGEASQPLWQWLTLQPAPFPQLHTEGVAFIAREETGGLDYYQMVTRWPHYPGHESGITIGAGYDLRCAREHEFIEHWERNLPGPHLDELRKDLGKKGSKARIRELRKLGVEIPFQAAWPAFVHHTLPQCFKLTESIFPSLSLLPDLCRSALVSLVFNRGTSLRGSRRKEMRQIQTILADTADSPLKGRQLNELLLGVEDQLISMKRLWATGSGLIKRRQTEANLWRRGLLLDE